jgi:ribose 1,5-bisphosphokinase
MNLLARVVRRPGAPELGAGIPAGCFVAVVGPSGAGKDTLISGVQDRLTGDRRFVFARRIITRSPDCTEDHDTLTELEFARMRAAGAFLLSWMANGLSYGLPGGLGFDLEDGRVVIANVSRTVLPEVRQRFRRHLVVHVVADPAVLAARLSARAREDAAAQQARLARAVLHDATVCADVTIDNSDTLDRSLMEFEQTLKSLAYSAPLGL